jgi:hypothetical protein
MSATCDHGHQADQVRTFYKRGHDLLHLCREHWTSEMRLRRTANGILRTQGRAGDRLPIRAWPGGSR